MISSTNALILAFCVLIFALRSYRKGFWQVAINMVALLCAYAISYLLSPYLGEYAKSQSSNAAITFVVLLILLFLLVSSTISFLPTLLFPQIKIITSRNKVTGAVLGAMTGVVVGVVVIWMVAFIGVFLQPSEPGSDHLPSQDIVSRVSSQIVAKIVRSGMMTVEQDEFKANATAALVSAPKVYSQAISQLSQSSELQEFWHDGKAQFLMGEGDIDGVIQDSRFLALMKLPASQALLQASKPKAMSETEAQRYMASQMSYVWRRMRSLRSDQRVVSILEDPEVQDLANNKNPIALLGNKKVQSLISIIMEEPLEVESQGREIDPLPAKAQVLPQPELRVIYKWRDNNGEIRYTDFKNTPEERRDSAEKLTH